MLEGKEKEKEKRERDGKKKKKIILGKGERNERGKEDKGEKLVEREKELQRIER